MHQITLKELCDACGVSRRAVQGYEKYGLLTPSGKTDRGYLLYDEDAAETVRRIRLYQDFGFTVKEIRALQELSPGELAEKLTGKKNRLLHIVRDTERLTREIDAIIEDCRKKQNG